MGGPWEGTRAEGAQETINQRLHCPSPPGTCGVLTLTTGHLWGSDLSPLGTYRVLTSHYWAPVGHCSSHTRTWDPPLVSS